MTWTSTPWNNNHARRFEPQEIQVGDKTFTANTPQELRALQEQRLKSLNDEALRASMPGRPKFDSMLGKDKLIDKRYQINDFAQGLLSGNKGFDKFQQEALRDGPSAYAKMMLEQQEMDRMGALDDVGSQYQMGVQNQMDMLASQGGLMSGAGERMGASSIRDMLAARQGVRRNNDQNRLGIMGQDEQNRLQQLQGLTGLEQQRNQTSLQAREFDLRNSLNERDAKRRDGQDAWKTEMETWASNRQADAQAKAAGGRSGGCCFIFLEARYGDGTMDSVVRSYREEKMTAKNKRGYYKLSEVLVPAMRKSKVIKFLTRVLMTDPLVSYGKYYYGQNKHGFIFKPIHDFWMTVFESLGDDHEFIRENGEVV